MKIAIYDLITGRIWSSHGEVHPRLLYDVRTELGITGAVFSERLPDGNLLVDSRLYEGYVPTDNPDRFYHRAEAEALVGGEPHLLG